MKLSHSKLACILNCPMTYFLQYRQGIQPKVTKAALSLGSAVHWGLEHNTDNLDEYYASINNGRTANNYTDEQVLAEAMVHGFLKNKEQILKDFFTHPITGERLTIVKETHELFVTGKLKSFKFSEPHDFIGIIDLLFLVQDSKGCLYFIVIDYKTSTYEPKWDDYLDQIFRYVFMLNTAFPEVPVLRTGIINLRKTKIKQRQNESQYQFRQRIKLEYEINDGTYIHSHLFDTDTLDKKQFDNYIDNLSRQADMAELIDLNNCWFINFAAANGQYGRSPYWDIFYKTPNCYVLYNISDNIYNRETKELMKMRDCRPLDMMVIDNDNVLNKYEQFKVQALAYYSTNNDIDKDKFFAHLKKDFIVDEFLLEEYWNTLLHEIEEDAEKE